MQGGGGIKQANRIGGSYRGRKGHSWTRNEGIWEERCENEGYEKMITQKNRLVNVNWGREEG